MFNEMNRHCRDAQDQAASAIQALARAFHPERSRGALRNDLSDARERLRTAMQSIDAALKISQEPGLTEADKVAQGKRCSCHSTDDLCPCQNVRQP